MHPAGLDHVRPKHSNDTHVMPIIGNNTHMMRKGLICAKQIADWIVSVQQPWNDGNPAAGSIPFEVDHRGDESCAPQWNHAFAIMGLLSSYKEFGETQYEKAALRIAGYLNTLQILDPFDRGAYGGIREFTPQTPWCYVRDALSAAWAFVELYRHTRKEEYLERAKLWGKWFLTNGLDDEGWPWWGCQFGPYTDRAPQMRNDVQGCFHGGSLNFLYQLAEATGDTTWTGEMFVRMADHFIAHIQQDDGFFRSIDRISHKCMADPQRGLHRSNDDWGTLGLLCAYDVTKDGRYLIAIQRFLDAVFRGQREDGHFEQSCAGIPVVLNTVHEGRTHLQRSEVITENAMRRALEALMSRQSSGEVNPRMKGGLLENKDDTVEMRSSCYALIVLLKLCGQQKDYLRVSC